MARVLVSGAAGFVGSHLVDRLLADGDVVVGVDDLSTGNRANVAHLAAHPRWSLVEADCVDLPVAGRFDRIYHLGSASSPTDFRSRALEILRAGSAGTWRLLERAERDGARLLFASTSEIYGNPDVHPQPESYWGRVSSIGPRSCYDEAKRFGEALCVAFRDSRGVEVRLPRIFNTYGPRMRRDDGRAVPTFFDQALRGAPITVHGDGSQTRSLCFVADLVEGLLRLMESDVDGPCNLGRPGETTMVELAERIRDVCGSPSEVVFRPRPGDDPQRRCPDIALARTRLGWEPQVSLDDGLAACLHHYRSDNADRPERVPTVSAR